MQLNMHWYSIVHICTVQLYSRGGSGLGPRSPSVFSSFLEAWSFSIKLRPESGPRLKEKPGVGEKVFQWPPGIECLFKCGFIKWGLYEASFFNTVDVICVRDVKNILCRFYTVDFSKEEGDLSARIAASLYLFFFFSLTILEIYWNNSKYVGTIPIFLKYSNIFEIFQYFWNIPNILEIFQIY